MPLLNPKIGDKILVCSDSSDPSGLKEYTVSKVGSLIVQCNGDNDLIFSTAFCWPIEAKEKLLEVLKTRAHLKKAYDDSMKLIYELSNQVKRGEIL